MTITQSIPDTTHKLHGMLMSPFSMKLRTYGTAASPFSGAIMRVHMKSP